MVFDGVQLQCQPSPRWYAFILVLPCLVASLRASVRVGALVAAMLLVGSTLMVMGVMACELDSAMVRDQCRAMLGGGCRQLLGCAPLGPRGLARDEGMDASYREALTQARWLMPG